MCLKEQRSSQGAGLGDPGLTISWVFFFLPSRAYGSLGTGHSLMSIIQSRESKDKYAMSETRDGSAGGNDQET